jgi:hypothetical protein
LHCSQSESQDPREKGLYATIPRSLKADVAVRAVTEDPELVRARRELLASKSVGELAALTSLSDIPLPEAIENLFSGKKPKSSVGKENKVSEDE